MEAFNLLFDKFPRFIGPRQKLIKSIDELYKHRYINSGVEDCFTSVYAFPFPDKKIPLIDKLFLEADGIPKESLKIGQIMFEWLTENGFTVVPNWSGSESPHIYPICNPIKLDDTIKSAEYMKRTTYYILEETGLYKESTVKGIDGKDRIVKIPLIDSVIIGDVSKGAIVILLIRLGLFGDAELLLHPLAYGFASAFGHAFSVFIKFKGGKAVGTTVGAMSAFSPLLSFITGIFFFLGLKVTKYVSIGSTSYAIGLVIVALVVQDYEMLFFVCLSALLIFYRHRSNYSNIKNKVEPKITWM